MDVPYGGLLSIVLVGGASVIVPPHPACGIADTSRGDGGIQRFPGAGGWAIRAAAVGAGSCPRPEASPRPPAGQPVADRRRGDQRPGAGPQLLACPTSGGEVGVSPTASPQKWGWVLPGPVP